MTVVSVEASAESDLEELYGKDQATAALAVALIEEMQDNPELAETLTEHGHRDMSDPAYEVKRFEEFWRQGKNLLFLKFWDYEGSLVPYRIIYAYHAQQNCVHVLAVVERDFDYDKHHPIVSRIFADYQRLGIPTY